MYRNRTCGELRLANEGEVVILAGWVQKTRKMGGMTFVDIRDRYGITQLVFNQETNADLCEKANKLGREFVIQATGTVKERSSKNMNIPTGEIDEYYYLCIAFECRSGRNDEPLAKERR